MNLDSQISSKLDRLRKAAEEGEREDDEIEEVYNTKHHLKGIHKLINEINPRSSQTFVEDDKSNLEENDDESLYTYTTDEGGINDEEWENVLHQLQVVVTIVLIPIAGKFLGRRFAHYVWKIVAGWIYN